MAQTITGKGINLKLPDATYDIVFAKSLEMSKDKKRKVSLAETTIHIINEWGKNKKQ